MKQDGNELSALRTSLTRPDSTSIGQHLVGFQGSLVYKRYLHYRNINSIFFLYQGTDGKVQDLVEWLMSKPVSSDSYYSMVLLNHISSTITFVGDSDGTNSLSFCI